MKTQYSVVSISERALHSEYLLNDFKQGRQSYVINITVL